jgi:hypothetical protein
MIKVGGDYQDVYSVVGGLWILTGDCAGKVGVNLRIESESAVGGERTDGTNCGNCCSIVSEDFSSKFVSFVVSGSKPPRPFSY